MSKSVFKNSMVAHVWAQQEQESGRSNNGNFWFEGSTLYSYQTAIANIVQTPAGSVALVTSESYSVSTSGQVSEARSAARHLTQFSVPYLAIMETARRGRYGRYDDNGLTAPEQHTHNLADLIGRYRGELSRLLRGRDDPADSDWRKESLTDRARDATQYANLFSLPTPEINAESDWQAVCAEWTRKRAERDTPQAAAKRAKDKAKREAIKSEKLRLERLEGAERIAEWKAGKPVNLRWQEQRDSTGGALLRVRGDNLETSMGATVPLDHAVRVFQLAKFCRERETVWQRNGHTVRVGHFQVDSVRNDGSIVAGCHTLNWPEIEAAARQAGVWDKPAEAPHYIAEPTA